VADFNGRIGAIVQTFQENEPGNLGSRAAVRRVLAAERKEGWDEGYREGAWDAGEAYRLEREREGGTIGPPLEQDGHHPEGDYDLWHLAVYIPAIPCGSEEAVAELLAANGIETYRMWPVENGAQMKAAMDEFTESLVKTSTEEGSGDA
jgi:hypothetical protein